MIFDPLYIIMILPALLLSIYAQFKVKSTYSRFSKVSTYRGITGARAAREILRSAGVHDVDIELTRAFFRITMIPVPGC